MTIGQMLAGAALIAGLLMLTLQARSFFQRRASKRPSVDELLSELHAQKPWHYRWVEGKRGVQRLLPSAFVRRMHRSDLETSMRRSAAARQLGDLGTNAWVTIAALIEDLTRNIYDGVRAASVLVRIRADTAPQWKSLQHQLTAQSVPVQVFSWFLHGKDEFGKPYDYTHKRFALGGLEIIGTAGRPAVPRVVNVIKSEEDHELWGPAIKVLGSIGGNQKELVSSLREVLCDTTKYPTFRMSAAHALACVVPPDPETLQVLRDAQQDQFGLLRIAAATALWDLKRAPEEVLPTVVPLLSHKLRGVRLRTLELVALMGSAAQTSRPGVERLLTDNDEAVRRAAALALERLSSSAVPLGQKACESD